MLSPLLGYSQDSVVGVYKTSAAVTSGVALMAYGTDATPLTPSPYGNSFGTLQPATTTTAGIGKETGFVLQPVSTGGPSIFSILSSIYDESVQVGTNCAVLLTKSGAQIATDQYVTGAGTGAVKFDGTVAQDANCSYAAGLIRVSQTGDSVRAQFKGQVSQRLTALAIFQIN